MSRNDARIADGWKFAAIWACFAALMMFSAGLAAAQESAETKPKVSDQPLTAEQLAVYRVVLHGWIAIRSVMSYLLDDVLLNNSFASFE